MIVFALLAQLLVLTDPPVVTAVNETRSEEGQVEYASIGGGSTMRVTFLDQPNGQNNQSYSLSLDGAQISIEPSQWQVQLGAYDSEAIALQAWQDLTSEYETILTGRDRFLQPVALDNGQELIRLRASGYSDRDSAVEACESLQSSGQACFVTSNS